MHVDRAPVLVLCSVHELTQLVPLEKASLNPSPHST